jgi:hypothetical protein
MQLKKGSATVSVAPVGVPPTGLVWGISSPRIRCANVFGGTPKTAGGAPALPNAAESFRLRRLTDGRPADCCRLPAARDCRRPLTPCGQARKPALPVFIDRGIECLLNEKQ